MRTLWVLTLGALVSLAALQGCKQKSEPIPGPKALASPVGPPGIAWFQGSLDEAFARADIPQHCRGGYLLAPRAPEMLRTRKRPSAMGVPAPSSSVPRPRHRLV
jgi:hypothetical protein